MNIRQLRGDTLFFSNIVVRPARGEGDACVVSGPGFLSLADNPNMKLVARRQDRGLTGLVVVLAIVGAFFTAVVISLALGDGYT
ncbi:MAG: hypothetical protein IT353_09090 [Gemmatimonadaceae bacterium]|nr:hypothetical protein [Gemmatimonadaceae bacterium]